MAKDSLSIVREDAVNDDAEACAHHWMLESPNGALAFGRCRTCGAVREFRNATTDYVWDEERKSALHSWANEVKVRSA